MEVAQLQPFTYSALPSPRHIRVLELQQDGSTLAPLSATLCNLDLDDEDRIPYSALSYTWGQPEFTERLILNGAAAYITPNLAAALQHLRVLGCMRIWVDAVCIDQTNNDEKSSQIPLMANIYRNASRVIVWLGNDIAAIEAMKVARAACRDLRFTKDNTSIYLTEHVSEVSTALNVLVHLPWFGRRWVVQEVVFNSSVSFLCGHVELPLTWLMKLLQLSYGGLAHSSKPGQSLMAVLELWKSYTLPILDYDKGRAEKFGIFSLLKHFDHLGCADDRDRIFALLGMAENIKEGQHRGTLERGEKKTIRYRADYSKTTKVVYTEFAEAMAGAGLFEMVLIEATARPCLDGLLPSWVPDWRTPARVGRDNSDAMRELDKPRWAPGLRWTSCGKFVTFVTSLRYCSTKTLGQPSYTPPMQVIWSSNQPSGCDWASWAAEAMLGLWEFIVELPDWKAGLVSLPTVDRLSCQQAMWEEVIFVVFWRMLIEDGTAQSLTSYRKENPLSKGTFFMVLPEVLPLPTTESREDMRCHVQRILSARERLCAEKLMWHEPQRVGCLFLGALGVSDKMFTVGSTRQQITPLHVREGDELLSLDKFGMELIVRPGTFALAPSSRETAGKDTIPVYKIICKPSDFAILHCRFDTVEEHRKKEWYSDLLIGSNPNNYSKQGHGNNSRKADTFFPDYDRFTIAFE